MVGNGLFDGAVERYVEGTAMAAVGASMIMVSRSAFFLAATLAASITDPAAVQRAAEEWRAPDGRTTRGEAGDSGDAPSGSEGPTLEDEINYVRGWVLANGQWDGTPERQSARQLFDDRVDNFIEELRNVDQHHRDIGESLSGTATLFNALSYVVFAAGSALLAIGLAARLIPSFIALPMAIEAAVGAILRAVTAALSKGKWSVVLVAGIFATVQGLLASRTELFDSLAEWQPLSHVALGSGQDAQDMFGEGTEPYNWEDSMLGYNPEEGLTDPDDQASQVQVPGMNAPTSVDPRV